MDVAEEGGYLRKPKVGWYEAIDPKSGEVLSEKMLRAKEIVDNKAFWNMMFTKTDFAKHIKDRYTMATKTHFAEAADVTINGEIELDD
jgi:hypothetical protein